MQAYRLLQPGSTVPLDEQINSAVLILENVLMGERAAQRRTSFPNLAFGHVTILQVFLSLRAHASSSAPTVTPRLHGSETLALSKKCYTANLDVVKPRRRSRELLALGCVRFFQKNLKVLASESIMSRVCFPEPPNHIHFGSFAFLQPKTFRDDGRRSRPRNGGQGDGGRDDLGRSAHGLPRLLRAPSHPAQQVPKVDDVPTMGMLARAPHLREVPVP